ncbi:MAG: hypothetical protein JXB88_07875 [Spirochaetales bacterium]|nr:hypothetical protein [Spirochaetales bacterium]
MKLSASYTIKYTPETKPLYNAWVSPIGEVFEVDIGYHSHFVVKYLEEQFGTDYILKMKIFSTRQMYEYMEEQGWVRVTSWRSGEFNFVFPKKIKMPHAQVKAIVNICIDNDIPIPNEIR